ncbi:hypothetical protein Vadar_029317 [Vaccinium darrowii]|uniref:Uncharacterized protein n=1 Tax=Vaccinium darrowii TaxID=229202 RepID=A0ACB7YH05_9ERIC|nr:hypothetical protein Vadar_029317 [Vaccinium darrowii]
MTQSFVDSAKQIWSGWELRVLILLSLLLQIVLILFGNRRKYSTRTWVGYVIWAAYLLSDKVATFSLGVISTTRSNSSASADKSIQASEAVMVFWAPFLLVHLGGPDTITAYSLEDNELWLRQLLFGFLIQVVLVCYLLMLSLIRSSSNNDPQPLTFIAIAVLVSGVLKYGEKTWVLRSSSTEHLRKALLPPARAGLDKAELELQPRRRMNEEDSRSYQIPTDVIPEAKHLFTADRLFKIFKPLYANLILDMQDRIDGLHLLPHESPEEAFKVIAIELGFIYDVLFTKASVAHSSTGLILRSISLVSSSAAFLAFCIVVDKHNLSTEDIITTYMLVVGAICAEIYAIVMLLFSEWTLLRLKQQQQRFSNLLYQFISTSCWASMNRKRWSDSIAQYNLIGFCIADKPAKCRGLQRFFRIHEALEIGRYKTRAKVAIELKKKIVASIKTRSASIYSSQGLNEALSSKGAYTLQTRELESSMGWSVAHVVELDHSILLWHIATDLCYYSDPSPSGNAKIGKSLSDHMLYLLVLCPFMLPKGIGEIRYRDTCEEVKRVISHTPRRDGATYSRAQVCQSLLEGFTRCPGEGNENESTSVLFDGCKLARSLQSLQELETDDYKWDVITEVWIEILCYAASNCDWKFHIQELSRGGEFLTHVSLLMVHLGFSNQFRESVGKFLGNSIPI